MKQAFLVEVFRANLAVALAAFVVDAASTDMAVAAIEERVAK